MGIPFIFFIERDKNVTFFIIYKCLYNCFYIRFRHAPRKNNDMIY